MNNYYQQPYYNPYYQQQYQPQYNQQQSQPTLFGKIVDGIESARSQEVPIGMSGIYPKADGSAVYIKLWLPDGTTKTTEYRIYEESSDKENQLINWNDRFDELYESIDSLSKKIDKIKPATTTSKRRKAGEENE